MSSVGLLRLNGALVSSLIAATGNTQRSFAKAAGLRETTLCHALGGRPMRLSTLRKINETLERLPVVRIVQAEPARRFAEARDGAAEGLGASAAEEGQRASARPS